MRIRLRPGGAVLLLAALAVAGCSNPSTGQSGTTTTSHPSAAGSGSTHPTSTTSGSSALAVNVPVTDAVRAQLLATAAGLNHIPVAEFTGLAPGLTYYALDRATNVHWAGARLVPAPTADPSNPSQAQVSSQDEGSYYLFEQPKGGQWTAYPAGNTGPGTPCPVTVPPAVLAVWAWPADSCRPSGI